MAAKITPPLRLMLDIQAWQLETQHRSASECGALVRLKVHFWRIGPLPDDEEALARITGTTPAEWKRIGKALEPLFSVKHGEWMREDWADELEAAHVSVQKAKEKSRKGHAARWGRNASGNASSNATGTASGMPPSMLNNISAERSARTPSPNPKAPSQGEGFSGQPEFLEDVLIAESAIGLVGGGV